MLFESESHSPFTNVKLKLYTFQELSKKYTANWVAKPAIKAIPGLTGQGSFAFNITVTEFSISRENTSYKLLVNQFVFFSLCFDLCTFLIILYWLCYYSCPSFFPLPISTSNPHSLRQSLHHCSCPWVTSIGSLATPFATLCFTAPWLFCNLLICNS